MSLIVTSLLVAGGVFAGRWIAQRARSADAPEKDDDDDDAKKKKENANADADDGGTKTPPKAASKTADPFATFPCRLGDVVIGPGGDEAWLAGAVVLHEETPALALFIAPDAGGDRAVLARPRPNEELLWLKPVTTAGFEVGNEPPSSIEHAGQRFERARRLPLRAERHGTGAPDVGDQVIVAEYKSLANERLLVIAGGGPGTARAWQGTALEPGQYDVLASGAATLER